MHFLDSPAARIERDESPFGQSDSGFDEKAHVRIVSSALLIVRLVVVSLSPQLFDIWLALNL
ncbi:MAG: hypothetical protein ABW189_03375 [Rickettsiales bacterium]